MNKDHKNIFINIFFLFFVLSIFLDLHVFYNSTSTLIRTLFITLLFLIVFFKYGKREDRKYLYLYFGVFLIYIVAHLFNIPKSTVFSEILYFYKLSMNVLIIYITVKLNIKLENFYKILNWCLLLIAGQIVVCNIFKIGYSSYGYFGITNNIFDWFKGEKLLYHMVSSNGFFEFANQSAAIILLYLPLLIANIKRKFKILDVITLVISLLALLMLGNRIATIVPLIILVMSFAIFIFMLLIKKEDKDIKFVSLILVLIIGYSFIMTKSPLMIRNDYYNSLRYNTTLITLYDANADEKKEKILPSETDLFKDRVLNTNFPDKIYPYDEDPEFWNDILKYDNNILQDSRFLEKKVIQRVKELNDNYTLDTLLGIGYTRVMNIQNIEQDFIMQYYSIGILGSIIVLGVYIVIYLYLLIKVFVNMEAKLTYKNLMLLLSIGIVIIASYYSGNLLNSSTIIIPLSLVMGIAINDICSKKEKDAKILGFNVCTLEYDKLLSSIKKDLKDNKRNVIYNINPLIVMNFYKNNYIKDKFNIQKYNIPDGIGTVMALRMKDIDIPSRVAGVEVFESLLDIASKDNYNVYLYGAKKEVVEKAFKNIKEKYPNINIVGYMSGYEKEDKVLKDIKKTKPDMLFVATGSPKQENFIINNEDSLKNIKLVMPVGGSFDVISGYTKRSPKMWQKLRLEWLYRMIKEPMRIKANMGLFKFIFLVIFKNR